MYASGMAAASAILDSIRPEHIVLPDVYHGVRALVHRQRDRGDVEIIAPDELGEGDVWWIETPSNPKGLITDLDAVVAEAHRVGAQVVCDATFATPIALNPLAFGVDVVLHSATKAIAGHSDALAGALIVADEQRADQLREERVLTGAVPGSLDSWLALRGIRTLALRVERATASAGALARWLHDRGVRTWYPGLEEHPGHETAVRQMRSMGSMMSIDFSDEETAAAFVDSLGVFTSATSLGGVESLAEHRIRSDPTTDPGLVRLSIGIEDVEDLLEDMVQALDAVGS